jgi:hypothetical protein
MQISYTPSSAPSTADVVIIDDSPPTTLPAERDPYHTLMAVVAPGVGVTIPTWAIFGEWMSIHAAIETLVERAGGTIRPLDGVRHADMDTAKEALALALGIEAGLAAGKKAGALKGSAEGVAVLAGILDSLEACGASTPHVRLMVADWARTITARAGARA